MENKTELAKILTQPFPTNMTFPIPCLRFFFSKVEIPGSGLVGCQSCWESTWNSYLSILDMANSDSFVRHYSVLHLL